jgi:hypothetical protein
MEVRISTGSSTVGRHDMLDILYIGLALGFLGVSWGFVELCDRL